MHKGAIVFLAANASYSHTNLAGWCLRHYAAATGWEWREIEVVQTDSLAAALQKVLNLKPDVLAASFYLFNANFLLSFIGRFKALKPDCRVIGGGPEFLGDNFRLLERHPEINAVIRGEGELAFGAWLACWNKPEQWREIKGLCAFIGEDYVDNGQAETVKNLDEIPSPYEHNLSAFKKPFLLLETSRGCSNHCAFCTSAGERPRFFTVARVRRDLAVIAASGVKEVRLADRTFNENRERCLALIKIMRDEFWDMKFHLEIDPARLSDDTIRELGLAGPGRFHLEVGIQCLRPETQSAIGRIGPAERSLAALAKLCRLRGPAVHVDLIAGLPGATFAGLCDDLRVISLMRPDEIQLELLKVLPGTRLSAERAKWEMTSAPTPPYEVLRTSTMSHDDLVSAQRLSNLVDWFYNAPELKEPLVETIEQVGGFFGLFCAFCGDRALASHAPALENRFRMLERFCLLNAPTLVPKLGYAWLKCGLSAQHGICRTTQWKKPLPKEAVLVEGAGVIKPRRAYLAELDRPYLFVYGSSPARRPGAIYVLEEPVDY